MAQIISIITKSFKTSHIVTDSSVIFSERLGM